MRNHPIQVKVCGINEGQSLQAIVLLPIQYIGLNFYSKSPRYVVGVLSPDDFQDINPSIKKIGVFVNEKVKIMQELGISYHLDGFQLHGDESSEVCKQMKNSDNLVIKAFLLHDDFDFNQLTPYEDYVDIFLFDTKRDGHYGGTGKKFNWQLLKKYEGSKPFFLSGGVCPEDAQEIIKIPHAKLLGVDINSRFEVLPGIKDLKLVKSFALKMKDAGQVFISTIV